MIRDDKLCGLPWVYYEYFRLYLNYCLLLAPKVKE